MANSPRRGRLRSSLAREKWWRWEESNLRQGAYETPAGAWRTRIGSTADGSARSPPTADLASTHPRSCNSPGRIRSADLLLDRRDELLLVPGPVVSLPVQEEGRRAVHAAPDAREEVLANPRRVRVRGQLGGGPARVEAEPRGGGEEILVVERLLVLEERVVHLPEFPLRARGFGGLGGVLCVRVHLLQREVPEDEAEAPAEPLLDGLHDRIGAPAVRT